MKLPILIFVTAITALANSALMAQQMRILTNHVGYEKDGPKRAVVVGHAADDLATFKIIDASSKEVLSGEVVKAGAVDQWKDWVFWTIDFTKLNVEGRYTILA